MAFCPECGAPSESNADSCTHCGSRIPRGPAATEDAHGAASAGEAILARYVVNPFGNQRSEAGLTVYQDCLRLSYPLADVPPNRQRASWTIPFNEITQVYYRQDRPEDPIAVTIVSKNTISGPVPATLRKSDWLQQNRDAIQSGEIEVQEFTVPARKQPMVRRGMKPKMETKAFSYQIPEGWFFDQSGCSASFYVAEVSPEEAGRLFARLFALTETGHDAASCSPGAEVPTEMGHWLASDETVLWKWKGNLPQLSSRLKMWFRLYPVSEPRVSLTTRRLIVEVIRSGKVIEVSEYPLSALPCIGWLTSDRFGELSVKVNGPQAFPPTSKQIVKRTVHRSDPYASYSMDIAGVAPRPIRKARAAFDWGSTENSVAARSLGALLLLAREGRSVEEQTGEVLDVGARLTAGERLIYATRLTGAQDARTKIGLTNRRLILESASDPPTWASVFKPRNIASNPVLAVLASVAALFALGYLFEGQLTGFLGSLAFGAIILLIPAYSAVLSLLVGGGKRLGSLAHLETFIDTNTRVSAVPISRRQSAFVISWGSEPLNTEEVMKSFRKAPIQLRLVGFRPYSMSSLKTSHNALVIPAIRTDAEAAASELTRRLMAAEEGL